MDKQVIAANRVSEYPSFPNGFIDGKKSGLAGGWISGVSWYL